MNQDDLLRALEAQLLDSEDKHYTILINGLWGVGKTHVWYNFAEYVERNHNELKTMYLSFFGQDSLDSLHKEIKKTSGHSQLIDTIAHSLLDTKKNIETYLEYVAEPLKQYIICFDDLERKSNKISIRDAMGLIEQLSSVARVVVIADEVKFIDESEEYYTFKEKVIDRTYYLDGPTTEIVSQLVESRSSTCDNYRHLLADLFEHHGNGNFRTLFKIIDFIEDISKIVQLDERLVTLCAALIFESVQHPKGMNVSEFTRLFNSDGTTIYTKYNVARELSEVANHVFDYLQTNKIDAEKINRLLYPPNPTPDDELLMVLQNSYLYEKPIIMNSIEEFIRQLKAKNWGYFKSHERLITIYFYVRHLEDKFGLTTRVEELEPLALENVAGLISECLNSDLHTLEVLLMHFGNKAHLVRNLITEADKLIKERVLRVNVELFKRYCDEERYYECIDIIRNNLSISSDILYVFDQLLDSPCSLDYYRFVGSIAKLLLIFDEYREVITQKIEAVIHLTEDPFVKMRLEELLQVR